MARNAMLQDWNRFTGLAAQLSAPAGRALNQAADVLVFQTKQMLSRPGTGRTYKSRGITSPLARKGTQRRALQLHRASAPGEPPAPDTGELRRSIHKEILPGAVRVGTPLHYAPTLEFGTIAATAKRDVLSRIDAALPQARGFRRVDLRAQRFHAARTLGAVIAPRPFLRPALVAAEAAMTRAIVAELQIAGRGLGVPA